MGSVRYFRQDNMAQVVGYFEDFKTPEREKEAFSEGPFVIVHVFGWRIECEVKGRQCPALPDLSIYRLAQKSGITVYGKFNRKEDAAQLCDWLNQKVKEGRIICHDGNWVADGAQETRVLINGRWVVQ